MKNADGSVTVSFNLAFGRGPRGQKRPATAPPAPEPEPPSAMQLVAPPPDPSGIPKITRLLVLGYHFERLVRDGAVKDYAEIARLTGLSRARVTQIVNLTLMAPDIQEAILLVGHAWGHGTTFPEGNLRQVVNATRWSLQRGILRTFSRAHS